MNEKWFFSTLHGWDRALRKMARCERLFLRKASGPEGSVKDWTSRLEGSGGTEGAGTTGKAERSGPELSPRDYLPSSEKTAVQTEPFF